MNPKLLAAALVAASATAVAQDKPAPAPIRPVTDTYFGDPVVDPYRWLEDYQAPEAKAWIAAEDAWTRKQLAALPARAHYVKRLAELEAIPADSVSSWGSVGPKMLKDGQVFYLKRKAGESQPRLYHRAGAKAPEKLLYDPDAGRAKGAPPRAISWHSPSPDGKHVAIGVAEGGSERAELWVLQVATGKMIDGPISRTDVAEPSWAPDGKGFFYSRFAAGKSDAERYTDSQARWHALGATDDPIVFGNAHPSTKEIDKQHFPFVFADPAGELIYGFLNGGTDRPYGLYVGTMKDLRAGKLAWKKVFGLEAGYEVPEPDQFPPLALRDGRLVLFSRKGNPDGNVVTLDPRKPEQGAKVIHAAKDRPITYYAQSKDGFFVRLQDGPVGRVVRIDVKTGAATPVALPVEGSATFAQGSTEADGLVVLAGGWTYPLEWHYVPKGAVKSEPLPLADARALRSLAAGLASEVVMVPSHDGVQVPMSIIYAKGFKKDGTAPGYVWGYAGYGLVDTPVFSRNFLALAERGFVIASCHARGSGAYGERWHKAGYKATKPNTWKDFIACAEYLGKNGYASPKRIAGTGGSAGGITIGRAVTERPDVFAAAVIRVGMMDTLRSEQTANGKTNTVEFGTVAKAEEYPWVKAMSTYHTITDGAKYPALLLTHGFNDPRVPVWMTSKATARFQAASNSGKPVFARVDMDAGHGIGSSTAQRQVETADIYAFLEEYLK